jgi:hypothetical protein
MKRSAIEEEEAPRHYLATDVPQDVRNFIGVLMPELRKEGVSYTRQKKIFSSLGYELSNRTLKRYRHKVGAGHTPLSTVKSSGRVRALTAQQLLIFIGWTLEKKRKKTKSWTGEAKSF